MAPDLAAGSELAGYRIEGVVGRGGMGVVYEATQLSLDRPVALKLIAPELAEQVVFRERFLREARMAASLEHPHVLPVYEAGEADGQLFLALRFVPSEDLGSLLSRGPLSPDASHRIVSQLASALDAAHARGLLHRDVKPQNVLVVGEDGDEHAYLTDFGLARPLDERGLTQAGEFLGSIDYVAPEQIERGEADSRSDLYALGCLLYACLTGAPPFRREHQAATLWAHLQQPPPTGTPFEEVVVRALAKDPGERFQSGAELARALAGGSEAPTRPAVAAGGPTNLPVPATSFLGRERELEEIRALLAREDVHLLTLTGPGGTGKTRLALHAAAAEAERFPDGVFWVPLAPLRDPALLLPTIAQALELGEQPGARLSETVGRFLAEQRALVLVDNLEHLLPDAAQVLAGLLPGASSVVLVTSRERLRLPMEQVYPVPTLAESDALSLFVARARAVEPSFVPGGEVPELCARLDHLPLALELAAARTTLFAPRQLLERLSQRLDLLTAPRDADARQQTLRATIEWSHDLLDSEEQRLFRSLSVFAGGCTFEAAEEVCGAGPDTLQSLIEKSLVRRRDAVPEARYWLLETIREYADERLAQAGEGEQTRRSHAAFLVALAERAERELRGPDQADWLQRLEAEHDNFRTALASLRQTDTPAALRLAASLSRFWLVHGHLSEGRTWFQETLASASESPAVRAKALKGAGNLAIAQGDHEAARSFLEESMTLLRSAGDSSGVGAVLANLGLVAAETGELGRARDLLEESLALRRELGEKLGTAMSLNNLGLVALYAGEYGRAADLYDASLTMLRELGDEAGIADSLLCKGRALLYSGNYPGAAELLGESLALSHELGDKWGTAECLEGLACVAAAASESRRGAVLFGVAEALREQIGAPLSGDDRARILEFETRVREDLGDVADAEARDEGRTMDLDEAIAEAGEGTPRAAPLERGR